MVDTANPRRLQAPPLPGWLERMVPFTRYRLDVGGLRMHVMESGSGRPVLLLHGNPTWGFLYRKIAVALSEDPLRLIMPDLIGLGFSDKPTDSAVHRLERHGDWVGELIDVLDLRDLIFVGQDWGGPIGLHALAQRPERAAGLVLLNTVVSEPKPGFRPTAFHRFAATPVLADVAFRLLGLPQRLLFLAQQDKHSIRGQVARAYRYPLRGLSRNVAPLALARMVPDNFEHPSIEPLRRCRRFIEGFEGPSAIVWGDRDPILGRVRSWVEQLLPEARVTRTEAGHFIQEEAPLEIAEAIRWVASRAGEK